jgi:hypothetical protein
LCGREIVLRVARMVRDADLVQFIRWDEMGKGKEEMRRRFLDHCHLLGELARATSYRTKLRVTSRVTADSR